MCTLPYNVKNQPKFFYKISLKIRLIIITFPSGCKVKGSNVNSTNVIRSLQFDNTSYSNFCLYYLKTKIFLGDPPNNVD
jgi:hypothetical protein